MLVLIAGWSNVVAGVALSAAFSILAAALTFKVTELSGRVNDAFRLGICTEGFLTLVGGACLTEVNMIVGNAQLAVGQTLIAFGGLFFLVAGMGDGVPSKIISVRYILPWGDPAHGTLADASPFYGIVCFIIATTMGMRGVWRLPKNKIVSPFWGVACYAIGTWCIGTLFVPFFADGLASYEDYEGAAVFSLPPYTWGWVHIFQVIGGLLLFAGSIIFGLMDNIFGCSLEGAGAGDVETCTVELAELS